MKTGEASRLRRRKFKNAALHYRAFPENEDVTVITSFPWPSFPKTEMACDFVIVAFPNSSPSNLLSNAMRFWLNLCPKNGGSFPNVDLIYKMRPQQQDTKKSANF